MRHAMISSGGVIPVYGVCFLVLLDPDLLPRRECICESPFAKWLWSSFRHVEIVVGAGLIFSMNASQSSHRHRSVASRLEFGTLVVAALARSRAKGVGPEPIHALVSYLILIAWR